MERDINRLSREIADRIHHVEERLNAGIRAKPEPVLADFELHGKDHRAYYVPYPDETGNKRYTFEILIY